jgi:hypothetical protein
LDTKSANDAGTAGNGSTLGVAEGIGVGAAATGFVTGTPLLHTSFLPDLMQVNVCPEATEIFPALGHLALALTAANAGRDREEPRKVITASKARVLFMSKRVLT